MSSASCKTFENDLKQNVNTILVKPEKKKNCIAAFSF